MDTTDEALIDDQISTLPPPKPQWATGTGTENMAPGTSIFDPVLCELVYRWFCPSKGKILDPFAGGSVRGIVAAHLVAALVFELSKVEHPHVREAMVGHLRNVNEGLAHRVAAWLGFDEMPSIPLAAAPVQDFPLSPALQLMGKMKDTLEGRSIGILIADGSDREAIKAIKNAAVDAGATVKIVAPKRGGTKLSDGSMRKADGLLVGTPSVLFDAVAIILSEDGAQALVRDSGAVDFVRDAFAHLKAIAADGGGRTLLNAGNVGIDLGVMDVADSDAFITAAKTRQWDREKYIRTLP